MIDLNNIPEFKECTSKEQEFLKAYLDSESNDYLNIEKATITAFSISEPNALAYGRGLLGRPRVKKIVELTNSAPLPTLDEFKRKLWQTIGSTDPGDLTLKALSLYAEISGWKGRSVAKSKDASEDDSFSALNDITFPPEQHEKA